MMCMIVHYLEPKSNWINNTLKVTKDERNVRIRYRSMLNNFQPVNEKSM